MRETAEQIVPKRLIRRSFLSGIFDLTFAWFLRINWKKVFWSGLLSNFLK
jgi:hypothetical protein